MAKLAIFLLALMAITLVSAGNPSKVVCWGSTTTDATSPPDEDFTSIDADASFDVVCGLHDGEVACWGSDLEGHISEAPTGDNYVSISVGGTHACVLTDDGEIECWGSGFSSNTAEFGTFKEIASGDAHSCAIYDDDSDNGDSASNTYCWGRNVEGQTDVPSGYEFEDIACGTEFSCGRDNDDGQVTCWGETTVLDQPVDYEADELAAGVEAVCIIDNGNVTCWGDDVDQQFAIDAADGDDYENVYLGNGFGCALTNDHQIDCWGPSSAEELTEIPDEEFDKLALGPNFVCGRLHEGGSAARRPSSVFSALLN